MTSPILMWLWEISLWVCANRALPHDYIIYSVTDVNIIVKFIREVPRMGFSFLTRSHFSFWAIPIFNVIVNIPNKVIKRLYEGGWIHSCINGGDDCGSGLYCTPILGYKACSWYRIDGRTKKYPMEIARYYHESIDRWIKGNRRNTCPMQTQLIKTIIYSDFGKHKNWRRTFISPTVININIMTKYYQYHTESYMQI
jgi:hypothetical protein